MPRIASLQLHHYGPGPSSVSALSAAFEVLPKLCHTTTRGLLLKLKTNHVNVSLKGHITCVI